MRGLPLLFFYERVARSYLVRETRTRTRILEDSFFLSRSAASRWYPASIVVGINNRYRSPQPGTRDIVMADFYPPNEQSRPFATVISVLSLSLIIRCLSWENFLEYHEGGCLSASSISNGSSQKPQRQNARSTSVEPRGGDEARLADSYGAISSLSSLSLRHLPFSFPSRPRPSTSILLFR